MWYTTLSTVNCTLYTHYPTTLFARSSAKHTIAECRCIPAHATVIHRYSSLWPFSAYKLCTRYMVYQNVKPTHMPHAIFHLQSTLCKREITILFSAFIICHRTRPDCYCIVYALYLNHLLVVRGYNWWYCYTILRRLRTLEWRWWWHIYKYALFCHHTAITASSERAL